MNLDAEIDQYLYPEKRKVAPVEFQWDGFKVVLVFGTADDLETVSQWYEQAFADVIFQEEPDYHIYSFEAGDLHLANAKDERDSEGLRSFVGSTVLNEFALSGKFATIGVLRLQG